MAPKLYTDRDFLYDQYVTKRRNCKDIAGDFGITEMTVYNWCRYHDLLKYRGKGRNLGQRTIIRKN